MLPSGDASGTRLRWAQACAGLAMWCLGALTLSIPKGLLPFGVLLLLTTALVPVRVAAGARRLACRRPRWRPRWQIGRAHV